MIRDRGNIKWTAMMLPEHVKLLREWQSEDYKIAKPELDEWTLREYEEQLTIAYQSRALIEIRTWCNDRIECVVGTIECIDPSTQIIIVRTDDLARPASHIPVHSICGVTILT